MSVEGVNAFGSRLLDAPDAEASSVPLLSPLSLASCLAIVLNGAAGRTRAVLTQALGVEGDAEDDLNRGFRDLRTHVRESSEQIRVELATAVWGPPGAAFDRDFVRRVQDSYAAEVRTLGPAGPEAASLVNRWVSERTHERITHLVGPGDLADGPTCVLTDAVYFKGPWALPFEPRDTRVAPFTLPDGRRQDAPMMTRVGHHAYAESDEWQAVALDYADGHLSMQVLLPRPGIELPSSVWPRVGPQLGDALVRLTLPRFSASCEVDLVTPLSQLGLSGLFRPGADFSRMGLSGSFISAWRHSARVDVSEEGTEAAAASAVVLGRSLVQGVEMIVDRPFLFAIVDNRSGVLLFLGRVAEP